MGEGGDEARATRLAAGKERWDAWSAPVLEQFGSGTMPQLFT